MRWCLLFCLGTFFLKNSAGYEFRSAPLLQTRPSWLKMCRRSDPNLNECLTGMFARIFPELAKGIPEINVERFEPLLLDKVSISKGTGPVTLAGILTNLTVAGPSKAVPTYTMFDIENQNYDFGIDLPTLEIKSHYDLNGKILVLPLVGNGDCEIKLQGVRTHLKTNISFVQVDDGAKKREIVNFDKLNVEFKLDNMKVNFHNLFNGNKVLGLTVNAFLNQHALDIIGELHDNIGDSLATIFKNLINNVFSKMPTDLWLPKEVEELETTVNPAQETDETQSTEAYTTIKDFLI